MAAIPRNSSSTAAPKPATPDREQLLHLLAEASEIEHNLLCCYLYATFSLKREPPGFTGEELAAMKAWRDSLMEIALEEMTHLAIIANLTVAIGSRPHFNRPNLPVPPGYHPASIVVKLAPFSLETLDHFIFLERPADAPREDGEGFEPATTVERPERPAGRLMPGAPEYETLAEFYAEIRSSLIALSEEVGEAALFCGRKGSQVGPDLLDMPGLESITGLASALSAIDTIVEQGEGALAGSDDSHFSRFQEMKRDYERLLLGRPGFDPAWPVASNPVMRKPLVEDRVHVDSPEAVELLDLANAIYNLLLRVLVQAYGREGRKGTTGSLAEGATGLMGAFAVACERLATLPASNAHPGVNAGVTFAILRATEPLIEGPGEALLFRERLEQLRQRAQSLSTRHSGLDRAVRVLDRISEGLSLPP